jgi:hypothetical protein
MRKFRVKFAGICAGKGIKMIYISTEFRFCEEKEWTLYRKG